jgi:hypothetical protein
MRAELGGIFRPWRQRRGSFLCSRDVALVSLEVETYGIVLHELTGPTGPFQTGPFFVSKFDLSPVTVAIWQQSVVINASRLPL